MKFSTGIAAFGAALVLAAGCRQTTENRMSVPEGYMPLPMPVVSSGSSFAGAGQKISFKVTRTIKTNDPEALGAQLRRIVAESGGLVTGQFPKLFEAVIPVEKAEKALAEIDRLFPVSEKSVIGQNLTELMNSFDIRLNDLTQQRIRLTRLWNESEHVQDRVRIEQELAVNSANYARIMSSMRETYAGISGVALTVKFETDQQGE